MGNIVYNKNVSSQIGLIGITTQVRVGLGVMALKGYSTFRQIQQH